MLFSEHSANIISKLFTSSNLQDHIQYSLNNKNHMLHFDGSIRTHFPPKAIFKVFNSNSISSFLKMDGFANPKVPSLLYVLRVKARLSLVPLGQ